MLSEETKEYLRKENMRQTYGVKLNAVRAELFEAEKEAKRLTNKRNYIIKKLVDNDTSINSIVAMSGLTKEQISQICS